MSPEDAWHTIFSNFNHRTTRQQRLHLPSLHSSAFGPLKNRPLPSISLKKLSPVQYSCFFYNPHVIVGDENYIKTHVLRYLYFVNEHDLSDSNIPFEFPLPQEEELDKLDEVESPSIIRRYHSSWLAQQKFRERGRQYRLRERRMMGPGGYLQDDSHGPCAICGLQI